MNKYITTGAIGLAIAAFVFGWLKDNADFATTTYVEKANAATLEKVDDKLFKHQSCEEARLIRIENKQDQILVRLSDVTQ